MKLHEKIYYYRKKAGLSQDALADRLGISRQAVSKWETGESVPETGKLPALAAELGISVDRLLSEDEPEEDAGREYDAGTFVPGMDGAASKSRGFRNGLKHWCWLSGILIAVIGAYLLFQAVMAKLAMSGMRNMLNTVASDGSPIFVNGVQTTVEGFLESNPVTTVSTAWLIAGIVLMIAGIVLAVFLKKKFSK